jgi:hypothetical protein
MVSWNSLRPLSRKTGIVVSRYNVPLTVRGEPPRLMISPSQSPSYLISRLPKASAKGWQSTIPMKISRFLLPVKDDLGLRNPSVYSIPCECGQVYIGQTGRSIET